MTLASGPAVHEGLTRARLAVSAAFLLFGMGFGLWLVHIPIVQARLGIEHGVLGLALLCIGVGSIFSQPVAGYLIGRVGSRPATVLFLCLFLATCAAPIAAPTLPLLFAATLWFGLAAGLLNVAVNTQAAELEARRGKPTMSSFHGCFSLGGFAGALAGSYVIARGYAGGLGAMAVSLAMLAAGVVACFGVPASLPPAGEAGRKQSFALPSRAMLGFAAFAFACNALEGSVNDWSALYLATVRGLSDAAAGTGLAAFSATMAACRLFGGPVVARLGERRVLLYGGVLAAAGFGFVVMAPWAVASPAGFALVAVGLANTLPILISLGARAPGASAAVNVASVATAAVIGFLLGPPIIGFTAQALGLATAIALLALPAIAISLSAVLRRA